MSKLEFIDHHRLSFFAQDFIEKLGDAAAYRIMKAVGGTWVMIPVAADKTCYLSKHIDTADLALLCQHFAKEKIYVPKYDRIAKQVRNAKIRALRRDDGWQINRLALHFAISERLVFYILGESPNPPPQFDLFDHLPP